MRLPLSVACLLVAIACGSDSATNESLSPAESRFEARLTELASASRVPDSQNWQRVQDELVSRLETSAFVVTREDYGTGVNILGTLAGTTRESERVYVGAHYDTVPNCPGGNDNGSGLAAALEIATELARDDHARTLVIAFWDEEETGLIGSTAHVPGAGDVRLFFNLDSVGYFANEENTQAIPTGFDVLFPTPVEEIASAEFRGDFVALFANETAEMVTTALELEIESRGTRAIPLIVPEALIALPQTAELRRSDHAPFWLAGLPALHVSDTSNFRNPNYACISGEDSPDTVDVKVASRITDALIPIVRATLNP
ncbi:MAG: M28 family peptidase [Myxococcota bacterium]